MKKIKYQKSICNAHILWGGNPCTLLYSIICCLYELSLHWDLIVKVQSTGWFFILFKWSYFKGKLVVSQTAWISFLLCNPYTCLCSEDVISGRDYSLLKTVTLPLNNFMFVQLKWYVNFQTNTPMLKSILCTSKLF